PVLREAAVLVLLPAAAGAGIVAAHLLVVAHDGLGRALVARGCGPPRAPACRPARPPPPAARGGARRGPRGRARRAGRRRSRHRARLPALVQPLLVLGLDLPAGEQRRDLL